MVQGLVLNAKSSFFYVELTNGKIIECRASKKLKNKKVIAGDIVNLDLENNYIVELEPRINFLNRPLVSNIDCVVLIFSVVEPKISLMLLDKLLLHFHQVQNIYIYLTKLDLLEKEEAKQIKDYLQYYKEIGYEVFYDEKYEQFVEAIKAKKTLFTGQSGVGKSTLINKIMPELNLKTQAISKTLGRGKHTTRDVTFYKYFDSYIIDSPGFSAIDINLTKEEIRDNTKEFFYLSDKCKFLGCFHDKEPKCYIKSLLNNDPRYDNRYKNYIKLLKLCEERNENY